MMNEVVFSASVDPVQLIIYCPEIRQFPDFLRNLSTTFV